LLFSGASNCAAALCVPRNKRVMLQRGYNAALIGGLPQI
jgi:hypothetical protein